MTRCNAGALTVAGQCRTFTGFPSILAIAVMCGGGSLEKLPLCHETVFDDMNFYTVRGGVTSKRTRIQKRALSERR